MDLLRSGILVSEVFEVISDGEWHSFFSLHEKYRLSPDQVVDVIDYLLSKDLINVEGDRFSINKNVSLDSYLELRKLVITRRFSILELDEIKPRKKGSYYYPNIKKIEKSIDL